MIRRPCWGICWLALATIIGAFAPSRADDARLGDGLRPFVDRGVLAGAVVVVASPDKVLAVDAVGFADIAAKTPMMPDTMFWIASMNKPMTATALMMLVDEGLVRLDDPVEKYLPEFRDQKLVAERDGDRLVLKKPSHPITVREVLSHTSGLVGRSPLESKLDTLPLHIGTITYGLSPLQFDPGTKYEYCNPGINTVGRIIEVVGGIPYEDFMQIRLFGPLGMKDTTFWPTEAQVLRIAKSYRPNPAGDGLVEIPIEQLTYPLVDRNRKPYPAGGLFSTASDCALFCRMILAGGSFEGRRFVSENAVREMTSTQTGNLHNGGHGEAGYGLGWMTTRKLPPADGPVIPGDCGHGGAYATNMSIFPDRHTVTVFMVQHAGWPNNLGGEVANAFHKAADAIKP